jgi:hypothetical protein
VDVAALDEAVSGFREFLRTNKYPEAVVWVEPQDVLMSGRDCLYVKEPVSADNLAHVQELFVLSGDSGTGILFEAVCSSEKETFAHAWVPRTPEQSKRAALSGGVKYSAGVGRLAARVVTGGLRWSWLKFMLRDRQDKTGLLFRRESTSEFSMGIG